LFTNLQSDKEDKFTFEGISEVPEANPQYGASSSGSHEDLYTDTEFLGTLVIFLLFIYQYLAMYTYIVELHFECCGAYS
jgi:hypothetical protein